MFYTGRGRAQALPHILCDKGGECRREAEGGILQDETCTVPHGAGTQMKAKTVMLA